MKVNQFLRDNKVPNSVRHRLIRVEVVRSELNSAYTTETSHKS